MATANNEFFEALSALEKERGLPADYLIDKIKAAIVIAVVYMTVRVAEEIHKSFIGFKHIRIGWRFAIIRLMVYPEIRTPSVLVFVKRYVDSEYVFHDGYEPVGIFREFPKVSQSRQPIRYRLSVRMAFFSMLLRAAH